MNKSGRSFGKVVSSNSGRCTDEARGGRKPAVPSHVVPKRAPQLIKNHVAEVSKPSKVVQARVRSAAARVDSGAVNRRTSAVSSRRLSSSTAGTTTTAAGQRPSKRRLDESLEKSVTSVTDAAPAVATAAAGNKIRTRKPQRKVSAAKRRRATSKPVARGGNSGPSKVISAREKSMQLLLVSKVKEARAASSLGDLDGARAVLTQLASDLPEVRTRSLFWVYASKLEEGAGDLSRAMELLIDGRAAVRGCEWEYDNVSQAISALAHRIPTMPAVLSSVQKKRLAWSAARPKLPGVTPPTPAEQAPPTAAPPAAEASIPTDQGTSPSGAAASAASPPQPAVARDLQGAMTAAAEAPPAQVTDSALDESGDQVLEDAPATPPRAETTSPGDEADVPQSPPHITSSALKPPPPPIDVGAPSPPAVASAALQRTLGGDVPSSPPRIFSAALSNPLSAQKSVKGGSHCTPSAFSAGSASVQPHSPSSPFVGVQDEDQVPPLQSAHTPSRVMGSVPLFAAVHVKPSTAAALGSPCVASVVRRSARIAWSAGAKVAATSPSARSDADQESLAGEALLTPAKQGSTPAGRWAHQRTAPASAECTSFRGAVIVPRAMALSRAQVLKASNWAVQPNPAARALGSPINEHATMGAVPDNGPCTPQSASWRFDVVSPGIAGNAASPKWQRGACTAPPKMAHRRASAAAGPGTPPKSPNAPSWCDTVAKYVATKSGGGGAHTPSRAAMAGAAHAAAAEAQAQTAATTGQVRGAQGAAHPAAAAAVSPRVTLRAAAMAGAAVSTAAAAGLSPARSASAASVSSRTPPPCVVSRRSPLVPAAAHAATPAVIAPSTARPTARQLACALTSAREQAGSAELAPNQVPHTQVPLPVHDTPPTTALSPPSRRSTKSRRVGSTPRRSARLSRGGAGASADTPKTAASALSTPSPRKRSVRTRSGRKLTKPRT